MTLTPVTVQLGNVHAAFITQAATTVKDANLVIMAMP